MYVLELHQECLKTERIWILTINVLKHERYARCTVVLEMGE